MFHLFRESVTLAFGFCAAHRLIHHPGKCRRLHGHNYKVEVTVTALVPALGPTGMVVDFAAVKKRIAAVVDEEWDHRMLLNAADPVLLLAGRVEYGSTPDEELERLFGHVPVKFPFEPTAENLAKYMMGREWFPAPEDRERLAVTKIVLYETETCAAVCERLR